MNIARGLLIAAAIIIGVLTLGLYVRNIPPATVDVESLMNDVRERMVTQDWLQIKDYSTVVLTQTSRTPSPLEAIEPGDYSGFDWIGDDTTIALVKGFTLEYATPQSLSSDLPSGESIALSLNNIRSYLLKRGFERSDLNSYTCQSEEDFWSTQEGKGGAGGVGEIGFENGPIKCVLGRPRLADRFDKDSFSLSCGDISQRQTPPLYEMFYAHINPKHDPMIGGLVKKAAGGFAIGMSTAKLCTGGGGWTLWRVKDRTWTTIQGTQMGWSCTTLLDNKVSPAVAGGCIFYECSQCEGTVCPGFEKQCKEQEEREMISARCWDCGKEACPADKECPSQEFDYQKLYEEKFGKEQ